MTFLCVTAQTVACVAWRFCRAERRSGVATKTSRAKRARTSGEAARKTNLLAVSLPSPAFIT